MITKKFEEEYKKLNKSQKEAVDTIEGPLMVIAGPGTGKTTILTLRIANILKVTDTPPSGILALTFTEAGVKAMRTKLREIIGERALEVPIHTFHGFAGSVIREFEEHFPHIARSKQITEIESESLIREILKDNKFIKLRPFGDPDFYVSKILGAISDSKQEAWTPQMVQNFAKEEIDRIKNDESSISSRGASKGSLKGDALRRIEKCEKTILFANVYEKYEERKREERKIDFDDLLFELLKTLREDKLLLQNLQEKYLYILVDEHQDTNDAQNLIVRTIADFFETPNLFVVGDEKQAIYRFQGASVENFLSFQKAWSAMKIISLTENYRSHQNILDTSFKMIEQNYEEGEFKNLRVKLDSKNGDGPRPIDLVVSENIETEEFDLIERIKKVTEKEPDKNIAIIVRRNADVGRIFALLEESGVPAKAERGANIFNHPVGALYFALLEFLVDPSNLSALAETFAGGLWGLNFSKQAQFIKLARSGNLDQIEKEIKEISILKKEILQSGVIEYLVLSSDLSGFTDIANKSPLNAEVWRGIVSLAEDLARANNIESPKKLLEELLSYKKSADRKTIKINTGQNLAKVTVMTGHGSKGLEFDYVFLPYALEETWVRRVHSSSFVLPKDKGDDDDIKDERRLFYVALTRARKHITISLHNEDSSGKVVTPLRFLDELDQNLLSYTNLKKISVQKTKKDPEKKEDLRNKERIEYTKNVLTQNGLSVTALNHFMKCPNEFFYKSILKLPEAPSASSEKGNAMHEALSRVWTSTKTKNEKEIEKIIKDTVTEYLKKSLLVKHEKDAVLEELLTNAPIVASALLEHFTQEDSVTTEGWVETHITHKVGDNDIELLIHGKLDALIERGDKIFIYDYKTREALSVNAIKGETKDSDGSYFRQLIFYKMLLEGNKKYEGKLIEPSLVFVKPDSKGRCPTITLPIEKSDLERVQKEIISLIDSVWHGTLLSTTCDDKDCKYCGFNKLISSAK